MGRLINILSRLQDALMPEPTIYAKSLQIDGDSIVIKKSGIMPERGEISQTLDQIVKTEQIIPNCTCFGSRQRLCVSLIAYDALDTYRKNGLIFSSRQTPDYFSPVDLIMLTKQGHRKEYEFNHFIEGYEDFLSKNWKDFIKRMRTYDGREEIINEVNQFREDRGYDRFLNEHKYLHNEVGFYLRDSQDVQARPLCTFGPSDTLKIRSERLGLPHFEDTGVAYQWSLFKDRALRQA
ncbi:hypothetical protein H6503_00770 [Candidatus Woesearchaeota archaeon]|nr:hypothetical protein [Candidatus Woesearchaeota archaeon]